MSAEDDSACAQFESPSALDKDKEGCPLLSSPVIHLIPGVGAHKLEKLRPEHLEQLYKQMQEDGKAAGTAHQAHRIICTALNEAVRRGYLARNPAVLAKAPRLDEPEVKPYSVEEVKRLLAEAVKLPQNSARWAVALALGLRQGEVRGLMWEDVDLDNAVIHVRRGRLQPKYFHGCGDICGRSPGYCRDRRQVRADTADTKSRSGRRTIGLPAELESLLRQHHME